MHMVFRRDIRALGKDGSHNSEGADGNKGQVDSSAHSCQTDSLEWHAKRSWTHGKGLFPKRDNQGDMDFPVSTRNPSRAQGNIESYAIRSMIKGVRRGTR